MAMLRKSLARKLIFFITLVLILSIGIFAFININIQKKYLFGEMQQNAIQLSQTIKRSIEYEMLTIQSDHIQKTLEDIGTLEGIEHIRIFDKQGRIKAADSEEEIGILIDRQAEACYKCHSESEPSKKLTNPEMTRTFKSEKGYRVLGIINPIYNEPKCSNSACHYHPQEQNVLGVLDISLSLARFDKQIGTSRNQIILYFLFTFLFLSMGISLFVFLFVNTPIQKLIEGTRKIAAGDLNYRIGTYYADEIGELSKSFNKMTAELKTSREEIENWNLKLKNDVKKATDKLKKTNDELNKANKKLRELDLIKSDFMRRMEHGLRSHIGVMKSCLSLILGEHYSQLSEQQKDLIATAKRRSSTLLELLDDILLLSYRKSNKDVYDMRPVKLELILKKAFDDIQIQAQEKSIMTGIHIPSDLPQVFADFNALYEVFSNLLSNAVKYTREHGAIHITVKPNGDFIEITVSDTGIGISSEDLPKIFDEFYRAPNAKSYKIDGTGVGLSIVKEIVDFHQGNLKVDSVLGKGSTFTVLLPKAEGKDQETDNAS